MAAEWWGEPGDQKLRFVFCGHVALAEDLLPATSDQCSSGVACPVCRVPATPHTQVCVRDGVPHSSSTWGAARCRLRVRFVDRSDVEVCSRPKPLRWPHAHWYGMESTAIDIVALVRPAAHLTDTSAVRLDVHVLPLHTGHLACLLLSSRRLLHSCRRRRRTAALQMSAAA